MKLLAIDASDQHCSVALHVNGQCLDRRSQAGSQQHSQLLLSMQQTLLDEAGLSLTELDVICCSHGPGSFTGVRVATALCQGLAYAADLPACGVSTLASMAFGARHAGQDNVLVIQDARMDEVYWAQFALQADGPETLVPDSLSKPEQVQPVSGEAYLGIGSGWHTYAESLSGLSRLTSQSAELELESRPQAIDVAGLAALWLDNGQLQPGEPALLQPVYLRNQVTTPPRRA